MEPSRAGVSTTARAPGEYSKVENRARTSTRECGDRSRGLLSDQTARRLIEFPPRRLEFG